MVKLLLFQKNSPWGVILSPQKGPSTPHTMDFPGDTYTKECPIGVNKHGFINKFLMKNDQDWLIELNKQPEKPTILNWITDTSFIYNVDVSNYSCDLVDLSRCDFAVFKRYDKKGDEEVNIRYEFYIVSFISRVSRKQTLQFKFELDVYFTYNIEFKPGSQNLLHRGHVDRWEKKGDEFKPIISEKIENNLSQKPSVVTLKKLDFGGSKHIKWLYVFTRNPIFYGYNSIDLEKVTSDYDLNTVEDETDKEILNTPTNIATNFRNNFTIFCIPFTIDETKIIKILKKELTK